MSQINEGFPSGKPHTHFLPEISTGISKRECLIPTPFPTCGSLSSLCREGLHYLSNIAPNHLWYFRFSPFPQPTCQQVPFILSPELIEDPPIFLQLSCHHTRPNQHFLSPGPKHMICSLLAFPVSLLITPLSSNHADSPLSSGQPQSFPTFCFLPIRRFQTREISPCREYLEMSGDIFDGHNQGWHLMSAGQGCG